MNFGRLNRGEAIAVAGGLVLAISVFLEWYTLGNRFTTINSCRGPNGSCSGWHALTVLRILLLLAALAPAILAWIVIRGHALSWPRGELTAVVALAALTIVVAAGVISKPGSPSGQIGLGFGWWVALLGGVLILVGSVARTRESGARRKPPGVL